MDEDLNVTGGTFKHTIKGPAYSDALHPLDLMRASEMHATIHSDDPEIYETVANATADQAFTIRQEFDLNPHHRCAQGARARARRWAHILHWHWRKLIHRPLPETMTMIAYDVRQENITIAPPRFRPQ